MEWRDRLRQLLAGVACTACGSSLGADRVVVLAQRDELAFVEFRCPRCGSDSLGLVVVDEAEDVVTDVDVARYGEFGPEDEARLANGRPIDGDDVARMRTFLAGYRGDLRGLLGGPEQGPTAP